MTKQGAQHLILQSKIKELVYRISKNLRSGMSEAEAYNYAKELIKNDPQIEGIWHPIVIKFDASTLIEGVKHKPERNVLLNSIAIIDLGIIVDGMELDYGISVSLNSNCAPLVEAANQLLAIAKDKLSESHGNMTPSGLYNWIAERALQMGYKFIASSAGHSLGAFPTPKSEIKIRPTESASSFERYKSWMIEVHISNGVYGAFCEDLVRVGD